MADPKPPTLLFVCRHGAAKSVLAAALAGRRAAELGIRITALARGIEPDEELSPQLGTALPGIELVGAPQGVSRADLRAASVVVTFDLHATELPLVVPSSAWDGIPAVSTDPQAARAAIEDRVNRLLSGSLDPDVVPG